MLKKILGLAAIVLATTVASAGVASAQEAYPTEENSITADDTTVAPGGTMVLGIQVCQPGSDASFTLDSSTGLGNATANADGVATLNATIPSGTAPGSHTITGSCTGADGAPLTQVLSFTVTGAGGGTGAGNLPTTGSDSAISMSQIALAAIVGGGLLVLVANKRRTSTPERETAGV